MKKNFDNKNNKIYNEFIYHLSYDLNDYFQYQNSCINKMFFLLLNCLRFDES